MNLLVWMDKRCTDSIEIMKLGPNEVVVFVYMYWINTLNLLHCWKMYHV